MSFRKRDIITPRIAPATNYVGRKFKGIVPASHWRLFDDEEVANLLDLGFWPSMEGATQASNQQASGANAIYFPKAIVVTTDQTINQGDCVWFDAVNYTLKIATTSSQIAVGTTGGFCGCAAGSNVPGVYPNPPAGAPSENLPGIEVQWGGDVFLNLQANDVIDGPFTAVTMSGIDAQTDTRGGSVTSSNRIGHVIVPAPATPRGAPGATPTPETVAGGTKVRVWLERKYPSTAQV
jgi:hypothetical protein